MAMARNKRAQIGPWKKGMDNIHKAESLPADALRLCVNYDIGDDGVLRVREGATEIYTGNIQKGSVWSTPEGDVTLFVEDGDLKRLNADYTATTVESGVGDTPIAYLELNGSVYYSNRITNGIVRDGVRYDWGVPVPLKNPECTGAEGGSLDAGVYQVAITQISDTDEESGALLPTKVTVPQDGKIVLTGFQPTDYWARIYVSTADGEELYLHATIWPGVNSHFIASVDQTTRRLDTVNAEPPMVGDKLEYHNGRIYIADGNAVYFTDPLRYGLVRRATNFLLYSEKVAVLLAVKDGLYICSDRTYFLTGIDTQDQAQIAVLPYGAVDGTGAHIRNSDSVAWVSPRGFIVAGPQGQVKNLTENQIAMSNFAEGVMLFVEQDGERKLYALLRGGTENYHAAADYIALEVDRRGSFV